MKKIIRFLKGYFSSAPIWHFPQRLFKYDWMIPLCAWRYKNKLRCPEGLTIVLVHDRDYKTFTEKSLEYVGITNYHVIRPKGHTFWHHSIKITALLAWIKDCKTNRILYLDADDVLIKGSLNNITKLETTLFSSDGFPDIYQGKTNGKRYLCAGVFMGKTHNIWFILTMASHYIMDHKSKVEWEKYRDTQFSKFPFGYDDQRIFRYMALELHPDIINIDYDRKVVYR